MRPYGFYPSLCVFMGIHACQCGLMFPYRCLIVFMDSNVSVWVLIFVYASLWTLMGPYKSLRVFMVANKS